ncbi:hypothetical protein H6P81_021639 [Aristolochia fimbriata]|uniref:Uncharacterized protein n=1 Tax=Aristolochia fimbriata TaxID=158543 RepID=A0AAV7DT47_ARIFI|nr:hypothetical protein H6P81_021639 [Aristolochia fimbriata]
MGTFFPYHYITYGSRTALLELSSHIITLPMEAEPALVIISAKMNSIMKSMAMVGFFIENKGTFFPYHYITYGSRDTLWLKYMRKWVDNEIHGYGGASSLKIKGKRCKFLCKWELSSHIITLPMETEQALVRNFLPISLHYLWKQTSFGQELFFPYHYITYGNKTSFGRICENGSIMKSMAMIDFFIENKGTFFPYHYITYGSRTAALVIILRKWVDNEIHGYNSTSSLKIKELSSHIITLPMESGPALVKVNYKLKQQDIINHTKSRKMCKFFCVNGNFLPYHYITYGSGAALVSFWSYLRKWVDNEIHGYGQTSSLKIKRCSFGHMSLKNGLIMKSMAMVDFFIENKAEAAFGRYMQKWFDNEIHGYELDFFFENKERNFLPISLHYLWKQTCALVRICENELDNEIHGYGGASSLKIKGTFFPYHYITYGNGEQLLVHYIKKWVDNEIHGYGGTSSLKIKGTFFNIITLPMEARPIWSLSAKMDLIMKSMAMIDFFIENKELSSHIITLPMEAGAALELSSHIITLPMETGDLLVELFFPYHYITYEQDRSFGPVSAKMNSIMKSMAMKSSFFIENKGKLQLKQQDIINHTKSREKTMVLVAYMQKWVDNEIHGNIVDFFIENKDIITLPMEPGHALVRMCENGLIMKSMAMELSSHIITLPMESVSFGVSAKMAGDNEIHGNGKDFFIENKGTFLPISLHYLRKSRTALSISAENRSINKIHGYSGASSLKIKEPLWSLYLSVDNEIHGYELDFFIKKSQELSSHIITLPMEKNYAFWYIKKNGSIMKSMAYGRLLHFKKKADRALVICENGSIMKSLAMVDFFIENKKELSSHIITLPMEAGPLLVVIAKKWVDNEIPLPIVRLLH